MIRSTTAADPLRQSQLNMVLRPARRTAQRNDISQTARIASALTSLSGRLEDARSALLRLQSREIATAVSRTGSSRAASVATQLALGAVERAAQLSSSDEANTVTTSLEAMILEQAERNGVPLEVLEDRSFTCSLEEFDEWASDGRKELVMEFFYRQRRRALDVWVDEAGKPRHGKWNFDEENRKAFKQAPDVDRPYQPRPDAVTREVMELVERTWPDAWGRMADRARGRDPDRVWSPGRHPGAGCPP